MAGTVSTVGHLLATLALARLGQTAHFGGVGGIIIVKVFLVVLAPLRELEDGHRGLEPKIRI